MSCHVKMKIERQIYLVPHSLQRSIDRPVLRPEHIFQFLAIGQVELVTKHSEDKILVSSLSAFKYHHSSVIKHYRHLFGIPRMVLHLNVSFNRPLIHIYLAPPQSADI